MKRILVVEDDIMLNSGLCYNLELDKYRAVPAHNVTETLEKMKGKVYDLVVLDVNLPDGSGFNLCKKIRTVQDVPIVFLTARDLEEDVMTGFELGADDYITKPFNINIFRKKVSVILRRSEKKKDRNVYSSGKLIIDFDKLKSTIEGKPLVLTPGEYKMLKIFTSNPDVLLTRQVLLEKLYDKDSNFVDEHALTVSVNRLCNKIETKDRKYIKTVYGMGYLWDDDGKET